MSAWIMNCPQCGTSNEVAAAAVKVACGQVSCTCTCINCQHEFGDEQPYWRWLGLSEAPPDEKASSKTDG